MSSETLDRVRNLIVVEDDQLLLALTLDLQKRDRSAQMMALAVSNEWGSVYVYANDNLLPNLVLECVMSREHGDSISTLYRGHPIFNTKADLIRTRLELIRELAAKVGLSVESAGVEDPVRGRYLGLGELGTAQLIDLLMERSGLILAGTDNYQIDHRTAATKVEEAQTFKVPLKDIDNPEFGVLRQDASGKLEVV